MLNALKNNILYLIDRILNRPNLDNGFIEKAPEPDDYTHIEGTFGFVEKKVLKEDKNWKAFRPDGELQKRNSRETMACVTFSAMNCLETIINYYLHLRDNGRADKEQLEILSIFERYGLIKNGQANFSDRYIAKLSGTSSRGNTQKRVADAIRHNGLVPEDAWPWTDNNYYAAVPQHIIDKGVELTKLIEFNYEWVNPLEFNDVKKYGPIQTSVYAWPYMRNGIYQRTEMARNHAVDNDYFEFEKYDGIFDSYDPFDKKVAWNFNLGMGMLYTIHLKKNNFNLEAIANLEKRGLKYLLRTERAGEIWEITGNGLKYISTVDWNNLNVKKAADENKLVGISEKDFLNLLK